MSWLFSFFAPVLLHQTSSSRRHLSPLHHLFRVCGRCFHLSIDKQAPVWLLNLDGSPLVLSLIPDRGNGTGFYLLIILSHRDHGNGSARSLLTEPGRPPHQNLYPHACRYPTRSPDAATNLFLNNVNLRTTLRITIFSPRQLGPKYAAAFFYHTFSLCRLNAIT